MHRKSGQPAGSFRYHGEPVDIGHWVRHIPDEGVVALLRAAYSDKWKTDAEFSKEAEARCLSRNPF
jgi:hypothetical protein